jgi:hypothetical protein
LTVPAPTVPSPAMPMRSGCVMAGFRADAAGVQGPSLVAQ